MSTGATYFLVDKSDLSRARFAAAEVPAAGELAPGQVLLEVDAFALTANNVTYAVFGEEMAYWKFFPAPEGWGRIPVWGFADAVASAHEDIAVGERVYGYLPLSTHLLVQADAVTGAGFTDGSAHRAELHPIYNRYARTAGDPLYKPDHEAMQMLFLPLFMTSFLLADYLEDNGFFGAEAVLVSSASAKTAFGMAFVLSRNESSECKLIGLTSSGHRGFVERLACYDEVLSYDEVTGIDAAHSVVFVDIAGNGVLRATLHHHFGDSLTHDLMVGAAHWNERGPAEPLPGIEPTFFFAPAQIEKRRADWGPGGFEQRFAAQWQAFLERAGDWIEVRHGHGQAEIERVYRMMLEGHAEPHQGHILSFSS